MIGAITGVLASRGNVYEYFTSTLYPFVVDDELSVSQIVPQPSILWENPNDDMSIGAVTIQSGTLEDTIVYRVYDEPLYVDPIGLNLIEVLSGTLDETIVYITYDNGAIEDVGIQLPTIISGTLI